MLLEPVLLAIPEDRPLITSIRWKPAYVNPYSTEFLEISERVIREFEEAYENVLDSVYGITGSNIEVLKGFWLRFA